MKVCKRLDNLTPVSKIIIFVMILIYALVGGFFLGMVFNSGNDAPEIIQQKENDGTHNHAVSKF